jgi:uridine phosphorylase
MSDTGFTPHHLGIGREHLEGNNGIGRLLFLPGSDGRARRIGERFRDFETVTSDRQLNVHLGTVEERGHRVEVGAVATGMGCPSLDIVASELVMLGGRRFIRVGTAGSLQPQTVRVGDLVIATGSVRDEGTSDAYLPREFPAVAHPDAIAALHRAAAVHGVAERTFKGIVHCKDSLFARELGAGPRAAINRDYMGQLAAAGVLASEMESAHLFVLSAVHSRSHTTVAGDLDPTATVKSGALLAVIGDEEAFADHDRAALAEAAAIDVALTAAVELFFPSG